MMSKTITIGVTVLVGLLLLIITVEVFAGDQQQCEDLRVFIMQTGHALSNGATEDSLAVEGLDELKMKILRSMSADRFMWASEDLSFYAEAQADNCLRYQDDPVGNFNE